MADSPALGWYEDPGNATQLRFWDGEGWTDQVSSMTSDDGGVGHRRRLSGWAIAGIVACALLVVGGITAIIVQTTKGSSSSEHSSAENTLPPLPAPQGWETYISRSGAIAYAYDPEWTNLYTPEYETMVLAMGGTTDVETELAGVWMLDGSAFTGETTLVILAFDEGTTNHLPLSYQSSGWVHEWAQTAEADGYDIGVDESYTTNTGLDAWRTDFTMTVDGTPLYSSVVLFDYDVTSGVVYVMSVKDFDFWITDFLNVANSIVVIKPPVSP